MKPSFIRNISLAMVALTTSLSALAEVVSQEAALFHITQTSPRISQDILSVDAQTRVNDAEATAEFVPEVEYTQTFGKAGSKIDAGVSMGFDWPGLYGKRKAYASDQNAALMYDIQAQRFDLANNALQLFVDGVYANNQLVDLRKSLEVIERAQQLINKGYEHGQLTIIDVRKAELEVVGARLRVADVEAQLADVERQIAVLAGNDDFKVDLTNYMAFPMFTLDSCLAGIDQMPDVMSARAQAKSQRSLAEVEKARRKPGFSLGYVFQREINENFNGFSAGISLPMRSKSYSQAALSQAAQYDMEADLQANEHTIKVKRLYANLTALRSKIDALSAAALGSNYVELCEKAWRGGQINVLTFLQEVGYYIDTRMAVLDIEHQYRLTQVQLLPYTTYSR